ncbi:hypothetical protein SteCoe_21795 [Stentor coeruleus]|uniref:PHD-type domain-containing protein n=1 Tax=Stentor coeruleus TaxID=5963 RepID=A0A1R2BNZ6_9CILI|nr:hypothetical protein SteCoe_21795 [Stentor coeruleus]
MPNRLRKLREVLEKGKCAICMDYIKPEQGSLDCSHNQFCFQCISNWAHISNKCPLCMQKFCSILNLSTNEKILIEDKKSEPEEVDIFEDTICEICELQNDEDSMLLCDNCDRGFHTYCIGITRVPYLDRWFCYQCIKAQPENIQELQRQEIMLARQPNLPQKRSRRSCRSPARAEIRLRRSERLNRNN